MKLFIHSFGFRFHYQHKPGFDIFAFLDEAVAMGFSGVNVSAFPPDYPFLNGIEPGHIRAIRGRAEENGLEIDLETGGTDPGHLAFVLDLAERVGARHLRTYTRPMPGGPRQESPEKRA